MSRSASPVTDISLTSGQHRIGPAPCRPARRWPPTPWAAGRQQSAEYIEKLAHKYLGGPYPWYGGKDPVRVIVTVEVEQVRSAG